MKLNKDTRTEVHKGTILRHGVYAWEVLEIEPSGRFLQGLSVTAKCISWADDSPVRMVGRILYYEPLSKFYGDEIINE